MLFSFSLCLSLLHSSTEYPPHERRATWRLRIRAMRIWLQIEAAVHAGVPVEHRGAVWGNLLKIPRLRRTAKFTYTTEVEVSVSARPHGPHGWGCPTRPHSSAIIFMIVAISLVQHPPWLFSPCFRVGCEQHLVGAKIHFAACQCDLFPDH